MRTAAALALVVLAPTALRAAPDEDALGKAEGYPVCAPSARIETRCLVGLVSRRDEISPSRKVALSPNCLLRLRANRTR